MGLGAGLSNFSRGIRGGLEDIEARGLRKKQDERLDAQDARQAVENQQRDTVYGQNQAQYAEQQNQLAYGKQFENAMRSYVTSQGKDLQGVQQFFNQNTVDGAKVSLSEDKDGAVAWKSINADGTIRDERAIPKQDFMRVVFAFKDPIAFQKAAEAAEAKKAERVADLNNYTIKATTDNAFQENRDARQHQYRLAEEAARKKGGEQFITPGNTPVFDTKTKRYIPFPDRGQSGGLPPRNDGGGLSDAELRTNEQIMNARRRLATDRVLANDPRLDKLSPKYDPAIEEAVKIANGTLYGGDPQAAKFAAGDRAPTWKQGNQGLQKPQAVQGKPPMIKSQEEFARLPKGTVFIAPDGSQRIKP